MVSIVVIAMIPLWRLFKLNLYSAGAIAGIFICLAPLLRKQNQEKQYQLRRLQETSEYLEMLLYAFQKEGKILNSVEDVHAALGAGGMRTVVGHAKDFMEMTFDQIDVMEKGLEQIYEAFPARRIRNLHEFMVHVENFGGDLMTPTMLMMEEKELWEMRLKRAIGNRDKLFRDIVLSVITSLAICSFVLYIPVTGFDTSKSPISQVLTVVLFAVDMVIILAGQKYLMVDWVKEDFDKGDKAFVNKMENWRKWDEKKEHRQSFIWGGAMLLLSIVAFALKHFWFGCIGLFFMLLGISQHKIGRALSKRSLVNEIRRAFPIWLMDLVLFMQGDNVQNSLRKSIENAPVILKKELEEMLAKIEMNPEKADPYHEFLQDFDIAEVHSAMNLLYSMSMGQGGSVETQLSYLINRSQKLQNQVEKQADEDRSVGMYALFLAPVLTGAVKLLVDMGLYLISFLSIAF